MKALIYIVKELRSLLFALLYLCSCCSAKQSSSDQPDEYWKNSNYVAGEIYYPEGMAGCSYLIAISDKKLEPLNLHDSLFIDKQKIWVKYHMEKNRMSACMMGDVVTIDDIKLRK